MSASYAKKYTIPLIVLMGMAWGVAGMAHNSPPLLFPFFSEEFGMTTQSNGYLASTLSCCWVASILISGTVGPRVGNIKYLLVCFLLAAAALLGVSMAASHMMMFAFITVIGFGAGAIMPISFSVLAKYTSPKNRGLIYGLVMACYVFIGTAGAATVLPNLAVARNWNFSFQVLAALFLVVAVYLFCMRGVDGDIAKNKAAEKAATPAGIAAKSQWQLIKELLGYRNIIVTVFCGPAISIWFLTVCAYSILYLMESHGFDPITAAFVFNGFGIGSAFGDLLPFASDHVGRRVTIFVSTAVGMFCFGCYLFLDLSIPAMMGFFGIAGFLFSGVMSLFFSIVPSEAVPESLLETATTYNPAFSEFMGGTLAPSLVAMLSLVLSLTTIMHILLVLPVIALVGVFFMEETAPRVLERKAQKAV
jgi:sugar phosphate permease